MDMTAAPAGLPIELVCAGRLCVDLYAEQHGADLAEVDSFRRYLGGSAGNICFGTARLGVRSAMLARVGNDQNGEFLRAALRNAGADTSMMHIDPERLTPLVMLAVRPSDDFPRLFHYADSADMATAVDDIDTTMVRSAQAVLVTGSFLANDAVRATTHALVDLAKDSATRVVFDIDYRPALWGLAPYRGGNDMLVMADRVTAAIAEVLPRCDLVVGTREEIRIAGGHTDLVAALRAIRATTDAVIVMKVGAQGCLVLDGGIPDDLGTVTVEPGFTIDVVNNVGAGDGFFSGFVSGWLRGLPLDVCARRGNAVGALVVSRHGCSVAMPSAAELDAFLRLSPTPRQPGSHPLLRQLHRRAAAPRRAGDIHVLAIDHRWQMEEIFDNAGRDRAAIPGLKALLVDAFDRVAAGRCDVGLLLDGRYGEALLERMTGRGLWLARAIDTPKSRPVTFDCGPEAGQWLRSWPVDQIAKLMVYADPDDPAEIAEPQWARVRQLADAARAADRSLLVEFQAPGGAAPGPEYLPRMLIAAYERDITPDWWKLPPVTDSAQWAAAAAVISECDPTCHGMLVLGQTAEPDALTAALGAAAGEPLVRGFAIGRAIFGPPVRAWLARELSDAALVDQVAERYSATITAWGAAR
jgi:5-dehydro-2-deoxygluconokinase